jgi:hypothetical protein
LTSHQRNEDVQATLAATERRWDLVVCDER